jgi:dTDP-4-dehydrorhamnose reductase
MILITGGAGLLGRNLIRRRPTDVRITATQRTTPVTTVPAVSVDLADVPQVNRLFDELRPELVIHTAYGMNDREDTVTATRNVAAACRATGAALIHISTDALFDGMHAPYAESDRPNPITEYGRNKAEAEATVEALVPDVAIVRTSLITELSHSESLDPRSAWVANALRERKPITLFVDELRCPIAPGDLAAQIWEVAGLPASERRGVWHLAGPEVLSRYALGLLIAARVQLDPVGITAALSDPTVRPRDLRLSTDRADPLLKRRARPISATIIAN